MLQVPEARPLTLPFRAGVDLLARPEPGPKRLLMRRRRAPDLRLQEARDNEPDRSEQHAPDRARSVPALGPPVTQGGGMTRNLSARDRALLEEVRDMLPVMPSAEYLPGRGDTAPGRAMGLVDALALPISGPAGAAAMPISGRRTPKDAAHTARCAGPSRRRDSRRDGTPPSQGTRSRALLLPTGPTADLPRASTSARARRAQTRRASLLFERVVGGGIVVFALFMGAALIGAACWGGC